MQLSSKAKRRLATSGRVLLLAFFAIVVALPIYWMVVTSFKPHTEIINAQVLTYWPKTFTLDNYRSLFSHMNFDVYIKNSLFLSLSTAVAVTILSIFGGYSLARFEFEGKLSMMLFLLITQMIPGILVMIPSYLVFTQMGMTKNHGALMIFYIVINLPFCVITMRSFFERIPVALEEAAWVDGCRKLEGLFRIILPVMFPGIVAVFVFAFIGAWNELIAGTIFINTPDMWTIPVGLKSLIGKYDVQWGALMAGGVLALLPTAIMFVFVQRFVVEGLTAGGVKE